MQAPTDFAGRTQTWAREIEQTLATQSQLTRRGLILIFGLATLVSALLLLESLVTTGARLYPGQMFTLAVALGTLVWTLRRPIITPGFILAVCSAMFLNHLVGVYLRGVLPLMMLSPFVVMAHLLLSPAYSLGLCLFLLVGAQAIVWVAHPQIPAELWLRATGVGIALTVVLQVVTRHWRGISIGFRDISRDMVNAQQQSDRALELSKEQRDAALYADAATGLPNRAGFERTLKDRLGQAPGPGPGGAVVVWGLQSDSPQSPAGLRHVAQRASEVARLHTGDNGHAGWVATDEAGQLLALLPAAEADEPRWALRIQEWVEASRVDAAAGSSNESPACIGFAVWPEDGTEAQTLLRRAELALDMARSLGSSKPLRFEPEMEERADRQSRLLAEMEAGLARGEFELHYQPIVPSGAGTLQKAEALIRWNHPQRGRVSPGEFIPAAEQSYLIVEMTDKILEMAARQVRRWRQELHPDFQISVNMPPAYLAKCARHPGQMLPRLQALQAPPHSIVLEITEGALLQVDDELLQALELVRDQGFLIALDDFGIGYSSFGKLPRLPLDFLKLDKSFVDALERGAEAQAVCHTIVSLAHDLGMKVIAEGIEGDVQRTQLLRMQTDFFQGYLFSRPLTARDFARWARNHRPAATAAQAAA